MEHNNTYKVLIDNNIEYNTALSLQQSIQQSLIDAKIKGEYVCHHLLIVQHPSVFTIGKHGNMNNLLRNDGNIPVVHIGRGGDITYHGPGQLVVYPIIDISAFGLGVKQFVHNIEEVVIRLIRKYGITGERLQRATGVWLDTNTTKARKICAFGISCSKYITMHGLALNINTDLNYFNYINPCGITDKGVTSMEKELGRKVDIDKIVMEFIDNFNEVFGSRF